MPENTQPIVTRYEQLRRRLEELDAEATKIDVQLVELERCLGDDYACPDDLRSGRSRDHVADETQRRALRLPLDVDYSIRNGPNEISVRIHLSTGQVYDGLIADAGAVFARILQTLKRLDAAAVAPRPGDAQSVESPGGFKKSA